MHISQFQFPYLPLLQLLCGPDEAVLLNNNYLPKNHTTPKLKDGTKKGVPTRVQLLRCSSLSARRLWTTLIHKISKNEGSAHTTSLPTLFKSWYTRPVPKLSLSLTRAIWLKAPWFSPYMAHRIETTLRGQLVRPTSRHPLKRNMVWRTKSSAGIVM